MKNFKQLKQTLKENKNIFTKDDALYALETLEIDSKKYDIDQLTRGMNVELEHSDITNGDPILSAKIAIAHLKELPDYYTRLDKMERRK